MNLRETLRYLGYRGHKPDEQTLSLIEECWRELEGAAVKKALYREFPLGFLDDGRLDMGCFKTKSQALSKNRIAAMSCYLQPHWESRRII